MRTWIIVCPYSGNRVSGAVSVREEGLVLTKGRYIVRGGAKIRKLLFENIAKGGPDAPLVMPLNRMNG